MHAFPLFSHVMFGIGTQPPCCEKVLEACGKTNMEQNQGLDAQWQSCSQHQPVGHESCILKENPLYPSEAT